MHDDEGHEELQQPGQGDEAVAQPQIVALADGVELQGHQGEHRPQGARGEEGEELRQGAVGGDLVEQLERRGG